MTALANGDGGGAGRQEPGEVKQEQPPQQEQHRPRHICIVGGGVIGVTTAYHLGLHPNRNGASISLFETSLSIAPGASSKSGGFMASDWHGKETEKLAELSYDLHTQLAADFGGAEKWGYRTLNTYQAKIDNYAGPVRKRKKTHELDWVDRSVVVGGIKVMGDDTSTAQVTPGRFSEFLADFAKTKLDINFHMGTAVRSVAIDEHDRITGIGVTSLGQETKHIGCTDLIVCTGPWTGTFIRETIPATSPLRQLEFVRSALAVNGLRAHSVIIEGLRKTRNEALFTDISYTDSRGAQKAGSPELYTRANGTVYVCGATDGEPLPRTVDDVVPSDRLNNRLIEQTRIISPEIFGPTARIVARQACFMPISNRTEVPIINYSAAHGFGVAAGHSCWGITLSMGTGKVMSELVFDGEAVSADISLLDGAHKPSHDDDDDDGEADDR
ncbi:hypothetical protein V8E36_000083 [Tilletia maclaganii]